jgi:hypothetical protein
MSAFTPPDNYEYHPTNTKTQRSIIKSQILIHKLMAITALNLLPLLAWHNSTAHLADRYVMPSKWDAEYSRLQLSGWKTWVWVFMWILVSAREYAQGVMANDDVE